MSKINQDSFCNSSFWDADLSWHTEDPDLSLCFEQTVLAWSPCLLLWALSPLQVYFIRTSKNKYVPWHFLNISKLMFNLLLIGVSAISLCWSVSLYFSGENIFPVEFWTPLIQTITFILAAVILLWNRIRGLHTSALMFFFWLTLSIAGIPQLRTEIRQFFSGARQEPYHKFVLYIIYYLLVLIMLILNLFADPPPTQTNYPKTKKLCPEVEASYMSRMVFGWFDQLIWKGFRKPLAIADLWDLRYQDTSAQVVPRFEESWKKYIETKENTKINGASNSFGKTGLKKPVNIIYPVLSTFWVPILGGAISKVAGDALAFINPHILNLMIKFVAGKEHMWKGFLYAVGMFVAAELQTFFFHQNLITMYVVGLNWRSSLMSTIYKKALRISNSTRKTTTVGEVVNLMAVDAQRCADVAPFLHLLWTTPLMIIAVIYFLWQILGPSSLAGLAVYIIIIPINTVIANKVKKLQMRQLKFKDERIKVVNEVLNGIKVLKLYAWEPSFREKMLKIREKEIAVLRKAAIWNASTSFVWQCSSFLISLVTFGVFVLSDEHNVLTSEIAFVSAALFNVIRGSISFLPVMVPMFVQAMVSVNRINKFMNAEELDPTSVSHDETREEPLIIEGGSFSWGTEDTDKAVLRNITLRVKTGDLVAVVGAVGSGKSSLISALLGDMDKISGYVNTKGKIAYVPQQAWIQNASVRDNITFGCTFESKRYFKTVEACALKEDFDMLPGRDSMEIGEKGINLSGGQKQRVSLARAVYNNADIYLLDDPLSAVDSHVGKHIFENVIGPMGQLRKKTRVLVTHGVTFLPFVDTIVVMKNGEITEAGTYKELKEMKGEFSQFLAEHAKEDKPDTDHESEMENREGHQYHSQISKSGSVLSISSTSTRKTSIRSTDSTQPFTLDLDRLIQTEQTETGSVKLSVYMHYLRSAGLFLSLCTLGFQLLSQTLAIGGNITLSRWSSDPLTSVQGIQDVEKRNFYLEMYSAFGFGEMTAVVISANALAFGTTLASRYLHLSMLTNILRAPMSFFDTTPTGRIVNRFGKDVDVVDNTIPFTVSNALSCFGNVVGTVVVITWSTPVFATVIIPLGLLYYLVQKLYVTTSRQLKRIESVSRSPIYSHFSETVSGAPSVRAYKAESRYIQTLQERVDANLVCLYSSLVSNRWLGIRLETVGNILIFFAAVFAVLGRDSLDAGTVGLSISYALQITGMLNYAVRMSSEVETNIVSVERIKEYAEIPQEAAWELKPKPEQGWPNHGTVHFEDYQVRYREGLELVLKGVSFVVNGGEKIGIVGRTGAGKSSLTLCLFRILEAAGGHIYIDGIDISKIGLGDLRSRLTIIPQDPVLFSGSLRSNLDPFEVYSDSEIWRALELAYLKEFTLSLNAGLSFIVTENGDNLSVGQRQLICLARALLRKTQLLILDEATAAIDLETDNLIQKTIRREFRDCTVLTIAHRLNTIMDSDRVIVLEKGIIKEFDSPIRLLKTPDSIFYRMAEDSGLLKRNLLLLENREREGK